MSDLLCRICGERSPIRGTSLCTACVNSRCALQDAAQAEVVEKDHLSKVYATQEFAVLNILVGHCGEQLTDDTVERIAAELVHEMREGKSSWAFAPRSEENGDED